MAAPQDDASNAIKRFVAAVRRGMVELQLNQPGLEERSGISQGELSKLLSEKGEKGEPDWKLQKCSVLKRPERLASLCSVIELDDPELLRAVCRDCKMRYEDVADFMIKKAVMGFCASPSCHGATFVPQGRSALVVPFEKRVLDSWLLL